ncbi:MAG: (d)CMP kinase [Flavobacteriia bacterium]|mgnify:CR=1 FL=1|nr:(d)CMP kinase [Flavobacteriia bacterium]OJX37010.1 MAG: cytidylate kinase [Flavobacteriia bacterium 40-80]
MEETKQLIIAIDGYSSCGKSTLAKALAKSLNLLFIDTGAMYRAVTLFALQNNLLDSEGQPDSKKLEQMLPAIDVSFDISQSIQNPVILLNGENVQNEIRSVEVNANVSKVAANSLVRKKLVEAQRKLGRTTHVVLDGRDVGTVVFPDATVKLFLTASPDIRAQRRYTELKQTNPSFNGTIEEVKANLLERDHIDTTRADSPLVKAADAIEIDNSDLTMEGQLELALQIIKNKYSQLQK